MFHLFSLNVYNEWLQSSDSDYETLVRISACFNLEGDILILLPSQILGEKFGRLNNLSLVILVIVPAYLFNLLIRPPPETVRTSQSSCRINHRLLNKPICAWSNPYRGIHYTTAYSTWAKLWRRWSKNRLLFFLVSYFLVKAFFISLTDVSVEVVIREPSSNYSVNPLISFLHKFNRERHETVTSPLAMVK